MEGSVTQLLLSWFDLRLLPPDVWKGFAFPPSTLLWFRRLCLRFKIRGIASISTGHRRRNVRPFHHIKRNSRVRLNATALLQGTTAVLSPTQKPAGSLR